MLPFHVIVALARSLFGVGDGASPSDVRDVVRRGLGNAPPDRPPWISGSSFSGCPIMSRLLQDSIPKRVAHVSSGHFSI